MRFVSFTELVSLDFLLFFAQIQGYKDRGIFWPREGMMLILRCECFLRFSEGADPAAIEVLLLLTLMDLVIRAELRKAGWREQPPVSWCHACMLDTLTL